MEISKKRERQIKLTIWGICLFILLLVVSILFYTGTIQFEWSNKILHKMQYESNKDKEKKILVIGDSQLEKWPQINCLYKSIANFCEDNNVGHVNAAHHGFGPIEYLDQVQIVAPDYNPDLILIFYYVGNDLTDVMLRSDDVPKENTHPVILGKKAEDKAIETSKIAPKEYQNALTKFDWEGFKKKGIDSMMITYAKNRIANPSAIGPEYVNPYVLNMALWNDNYLINNTLINTIASKNAWYNILKKFEGILMMAEEIGTEVAFVAIPSTVQVDTSHFEFYQKNTFNVPADLTSYNKTQQLLNEFTTSSELTFVDLLPYFKKHPNTEKLYFENDDHLSELGHNYAFDLVLKEILTPYMKGKGLSNISNRKKNYYKNYQEWAIAHQINIIKEDNDWYNQIKEKAKSKSKPLEEILREDAIYSIEHKKD